MMKRRILQSGILGLIALAILAVPSQSQSPTSPTATLVKVTVTATATKPGPPPLITKEDVLVKQDNDRRPVESWVRAQKKQAGLDLAILVDDSLDTKLGLQTSDLTNFIRALPATTRVAIVYGSHSDPDVRQAFTADRELAVKALRLPVGEINEYSSIYLAATGLMKNWPAGPNRRAVLLISDGIDLFRGIADSNPASNVDLGQAVDEAQRDGVTVYAIFASGAGLFTRNFYLVSNGQGSLSRLALETGGEAYFQGFQTPLAFAPYLQQMDKLFEQQYVLTFHAQPRKAAGFARLQVSTELPGVELIAPARVFIPAGR